jgi:hypothetical protein
MGWTLQDWAAAATILSAVWFVGTTIFVWRQYVLQKAGADTDRRRFLRETIAFIHDTLQDDELRQARTRFFAVDTGSYDGFSDEAKGWARSILSTYGLVARMIEHGAIDEALVREYWRSALDRDWTRIKPFVEAERQRSHNPKLFTATERLAERWAQQDA